MPGCRAVGATSIYMTRSLRRSHRKTHLAHGRSKPRPFRRPTQKLPSRARRRSRSPPRPSTASPSARRSPSQRFPACFQPSCLLLAKMQVIAFRRGFGRGEKRPEVAPWSSIPGRPPQLPSLLASIRFALPARTGIPSRRVLRRLENELENS